MHSYKDVKNAYDYEQKNKIFILTKQFNDYDQHGEYFVAAFLTKPTFQILKKLFPDEDDVFVGRLLRGGGRNNGEYSWYHLREYNESELYDTDKF